MNSDLSKTEKFLVFRDKEELRKSIWAAILFIPFFLVGLRAAGDVSPISSFSVNGIIQFFGFSREGLNGFSLMAVIKMLFIIIPLVFVTLFEIFINKSDGLKGFKKSSLSRMSLSEGYKYADIWYFFGALIIAQFSFVVTFLTLGMSTFNDGLSKWFHGIFVSLVPKLSGSNAVLIFIIAVLLTDFVSYWQHRLEHIIPWVWDLHEFHHSATEMTIFSKDRSSPLSGIVPFFILTPIAALNGLIINEYLTQGIFLPFMIFGIYKSIDFFSAILGHSSLKIIYPKPISYVLMSPALHWLHHSDNPKHYDSNFSMNFTFWDKMFGTYLDESHLKDIKGYGVKGSNYNDFHPLYVFTILPINKLIKRVKSIIS